MLTKTRAQGPRPIWMGEEAWGGLLRIRLIGFWLGMEHCTRLTVNHLDIALGMINIIVDFATCNSIWFCNIVFLIVQSLLRT